MRSAVVVVNPLAGRGRNDHRIENQAKLARTILGAHGFDVVVRPTKGAGDAHRFAGEAAAQGCDIVVVWGGDGTVNEAARALMHGAVPLAIVPAGSGNGLAWDLQLPFEPARALEVAATGADRSIDAGQIDDCPFFNIAGVGVDALIAARFAGLGKEQRGPLGYLQLTSTELLRYRARVYRLTFDDDVVERRALLIAFANGRQYGNRVLIAPGARLDDGLLEVVTVEDLSLLAIASRLPALFRGTLTPGGGLAMRAAATVRVTADGDIPFHVDGEPRIGAKEITVRTHPGALRVRVPRP